MFTQVQHQATVAGHQPLFARLISRLVAADARHREGAQLAMIPQRGLADMGLTRRDVYRVAGSPDLTPYDPRQDF